MNETNTIATEVWRDNVLETGGTACLAGEPCRASSRRARDRQVAELAGAA